MFFSHYKSWLQFKQCNTPKIRIFNSLGRKMSFQHSEILSSYSYWFCFFWKSLLSGNKIHNQPPWNSLHSVSRWLPAPSQAALWSHSLMFHVPFQLRDDACLQIKTNSEGQGGNSLRITLFPVTWSLKINRKCAWAKASHILLRKARSLTDCAYREMHRIHTYSF